MLTQAVNPLHLQTGVPILQGVPAGGGGSESQAVLLLQQHTGTARVIKSPCPANSSKPPEPWPEARAV